MKVLIIAPHPDDEVLGCGGSIKKYSDSGDEVYLCIATEAYQPEWDQKFIENRKKEIVKASNILGVKKTILLNYPCVKLDTISQKKLNDSLFEVVQKVQPEMVFVPFSGDLNRDHRLIYEASLVATRPHSNPSIKMLLSYEVLSETEWGIKTYSPNYYEDISKTIKSKIEAMKVYGSELKPAPHPRSLKGIKSLAEKRGYEVCFDYAEAFEVIRIKNL